MKTAIPGVPLVGGLLSGFAIGWHLAGPRPEAISPGAARAAGQAAPSKTLAPREKRQQAHVPTAADGSRGRVGFGRLAATGSRSGNGVTIGATDKPVLPTKLAPAWTGKATSPPILRFWSGNLAFAARG